MRRVPTRWVLLMMVSCGMSRAGGAAQGQGGASPPALTLTVMTYNLKFASPTFKPSWSIRRDWQVDLLRKYAPDIIGTQEGLKEQIDFLMDRLPEYVVVGEGRQGGDDDEHMAIFFRRDRFRLREMSSFQLSETPHVLGSGPAINPRMVTWVRLAVIHRPPDGQTSPYPEDYRGHWENTQEFYVFNTHLFTRGSGYELAKRNSARLIRDRIVACHRFGEWTPERPVFLVGDFNARRGGDVHRILLNAGNGDASLCLRDSTPQDPGIDWILYQGNVTVLRSEVIDYRVGGLAPSDHKPVMVWFRLPGV